MDLPRDILSQTFETLRKCGRGNRECVVYWIASRDSPSPTAVVHPEHDSSVGGYVVDSGWVTRFFLNLRKSGSRAVAQVHTHPGVASHSSTDDDYSLVPSPGFLSLVIPDFALGPVSLVNTHLVRMSSVGSWETLDSTEELLLR